MVNIGRFSGAVGLKGEVRVTLYAKDSENLHEGSVLHFEGRDGAAALEVCGGNRRKAAEYLGVGRRTLYRYIEKYEIENKFKKD